MTHRRTSSVDYTDTGDEYKPDWAWVSLGTCVFVLACASVGARRELAASAERGEVLLRGLAVVAAATIVGSCPVEFVGPFYDSPKTLRNALDMTADEWAVCSISACIGMGLAVIPGARFDAARAAAALAPVASARANNPAVELGVVGGALMLVGYIGLSVATATVGPTVPVGISLITLCAFVIGHGAAWSLVAAVGGVCEAVDAKRGAADADAENSGDAAVTASALLAAAHHSERCRWLGFALAWQPLAWPYFAAFTLAYDGSPGEISASWMSAGRRIPYALCALVAAAGLARAPRAPATVAPADAAAPPLTGWRAWTLPETGAIGAMPGLFWCASRTFRSRQIGGLAGCLMMSAISLMTYLPLLGLFIVAVGLAVRVHRRAKGGEPRATTAAKSAPPTQSVDSADAPVADSKVLRGSALPLASRPYLTLAVCYGAVGAGALLLSANFFYVFRALDRDVSSQRAQMQSNLSTIYWSTFSALGRLVAGVRLGRAAAARGDATRTRLLASAAGADATTADALALLGRSAAAMGAALGALGVVGFLVAGHRADEKALSWLIMPMALAAFAEGAATVTVTCGVAARFWAPLAPSDGTSTNGGFYFGRAFGGLLAAVLIAGTVLDHIVGQILYDKVRGGGGGPCYGGGCFGYVFIMGAALCVGAAVASARGARALRPDGDGEGWPLLGKPTKEKGPILEPARQLGLI